MSPEISPSPCFFTFLSAPTKPQFVLYRQSENSVLLADYAVFAYILAIILARLALSLTNKQFAVFVLVKLQIAKRFVRLFIINIVPTGIAQISHQLSIPSSSSFSGLPTATVSLLSFIIGMRSPGIPDIEVVVLII